MAAQELSWLRHDQVGLQILVALECCHVREGKSVGGVGHLGDVARLVVPHLEVHRLRRADAEQDAQHLHVRNALRERRIEAAAALLDGAEMECGRVDDGEQVVRILGVAVGPRDRGEPAIEQSRNRIRKIVVTEIGIGGAAAIAPPPGRVHRELHEIGQALLARRAIGRAAVQRAESFEADGPRALRFKVFIDEIEMGEFVLGVVVNVLRHVTVDLRQQIDIRLVSAPCRLFRVVNAAELVVLLPKIGFEDFERRKEAENADVSERRPVVIGERRRRHRAGRQADHARRRQSGAQE